MFKFRRRFYYSLRDLITGEFVGSPLLLVAACLIGASGLAGIFIFNFTLGWITLVSGLLFLFFYLGVVSVHRSLRENRALISLHEILRSEDYEVRQLFPDGSAASPTLLLLLMKTLLLTRPRRILELGAGQSTKIFSRYVQGNPESALLTLEHSQDWISILSPTLSECSGRHTLRHSKLVPTTVTLSRGSTQTAPWYETELLGDKFDLVLIDGPPRDTPFARGGIIRYLPEALSSSFVIVIDDAELRDELLLVKEIEARLQKAGRSYRKFTKSGLKRQIILCSEDRAFLKTV